MKSGQSFLENANFSICLFLGVYFSQLALLACVLHQRRIQLKREYGFRLGMYVVFYHCEADGDKYALTVPKSFYITVFY